MTRETRLSSNGNLDLDTGVNVDNDLLDNVGGGVEVDETLVDAHLVAVPGLGALTARGLAGGDLEALGGQADGALCAEVLVLGAVDDLSADLLEDLDLAGGQGDADLVALLNTGKKEKVSRVVGDKKQVGESRN